MKVRGNFRSCLRKFPRNREEGREGPSRPGDPDAYMSTNGTSAAALFSVGSNFGSQILVTLILVVRHFFVTGEHSGTHLFILVN